MIGIDAPETRLRSKRREVVFFYSRTERCLHLVANTCQVEFADLIGHCRKRQLVHARWMAMWLIRTVTNQSYTSIARHFGDRDHTTIMNGLQGFENLRIKDETIRETSDSLLREMRGELANA